MRYTIILSSMLLGPCVPANAQVTITFGVPSQSIGINMPVYPEFQRVPSYPVYYAPQVGFNLFFYDGMYWAYQNDNWYASSWYNGPWGMVSPMIRSRLHTQSAGALLPAPAGVLSRMVQ